MFEVEVSVPFTFTHFLKGFENEYSEPHEHNWEVKVTLRIPELDKRGVGVDFVRLKAELAEQLSSYQGKLLNSFPPFDRTPPTAEQMALWIAGVFSPSYPGLLYSVTVGSREERARYLVPPSPSSR